MPMIFFAIMFAVSTAAMALGFHLSMKVVLLSAALFVGAMSYFARSPELSLSRSDYVALSAIAGAAVAIGGAVLGRVVDTSYDGQTYHYEAIRLFRDGWNYFTPLTVEPHRREMEFYSPLFIHYPTFAWMTWALLGDLFGNIESAKVLQLIFLGSAFCSTLAALRIVGASWVLSSVTAFVASANPVALSQTLNFYVDGLFASAFLTALSLGILWQRRPTRFVTGALLSVLTILVQIKFTSTVTAVIVCGSAMCWLFLRKDALAKRFALVILSFVFFAVGVIGYHPFVTNVVQTGSVFYPISTSTALGDGSENLAFQDVQLPLNFRDKNRFSKLFLSTFSRSANPFDRDAAAVKLPWQLDRAEIEIFRLPDVRVGGFGPLYALALLLGILGFVFLYRGEATKRDALALPVILLLSAAANPECWWARYVPQLWLVPIALSLPALLASRRRVLPICAVAAMLVNSVLVGASASTEGYRASAGLKGELYRIQAEQRPIAVQFNRFRANELRLAERGIAFREEDLSACRSPIILRGSHTKVCLDPPPQL